MFTNRTSVTTNGSPLKQHKDFANLSLNNTSLNSNNGAHAQTYNFESNNYTNNNFNNNNRSFIKDNLNVSNNR